MSHRRDNDRWLALHDRPFTPGGLRWSPHLVGHDREVRCREIFFAVECFPAVSIPHKVAFLHAEEVMDGDAKSEFSGGTRNLTRNAHCDIARFRQNEFSQFHLDPGEPEVTQQVFRDLVRQGLD